MMFSVCEAACQVSVTSVRQLNVNQVNVRRGECRAVKVALKVTALTIVCTVILTL